MPRAPVGPRLYLDPKRRQWAIRDGREFIRTSCSESQREQAEEKLARYIASIEPPPLPGKEGGGHVYFLRAGNLVKIGRTTDLATRIATIQKHTPIKLRLVWALAGDANLEMSLHRRFKEYRKHGEWFEIKGELKDYLSTLGADAGELDVPRHSYKAGTGAIGNG